MTPRPGVHLQQVFNAGRAAARNGRLLKTAAVVAASVGLLLVTLSALVDRAPRVGGTLALTDRAVSP